MATVPSVSSAFAEAEWKNPREAGMLFCLYNAGSQQMGEDGPECSVPAPRLGRRARLHQISFFVLLAMTSNNRQVLLPGMEPDAAAARRSASRRPAQGADSLRAVPATTGLASDVAAAAPGNVPDLRGTSVWAVDAHSLLFQVFHAIPEMSSPTWHAEIAGYGFPLDVPCCLEIR